MHWSGAARPHQPAPVRNRPHRSDRVARCRLPGSTAEVRHPRNRHAPSAGIAPPPGEMRRATRLLVHRNEHGMALA